MTRWTMGAVACAVSMVFAAPLWAQTSSPADQSTSTSPATTNAAPATPPPTATGATAPSSACAGLTGTARADCLNHENASNALCFGMNERVRADCVKSYYPNDAQAPARPATAPSTSSTTEAPASAGMSGNADRGVSGSTATGGGAGGRTIQQ